MSERDDEDHPKTPLELALELADAQQSLDQIGAALKMSRHSVDDETPNDTAVRVLAAAYRDLLRGTDWRPISEEPPVAYGWHLAAMLPENHTGMRRAQINTWRKEHGLTKVWYDKHSPAGQWWAHKATTGGSVPVDALVTHWAPTPTVPRLDPDSGRCPVCDRHD